MFLDFRCVAVLLPDSACSSGNSWTPQSKKMTATFKILRNGGLTTAGKAPMHAAQLGGALKLLSPNN